MRYSYHEPVHFPGATISPSYVRQGAHRFLRSTQQSKLLVILIAGMLLTALVYCGSWLLPSPLPHQLTGTWQAHTIMRHGVRASLTGIAYEFRSDYATRRIYGDGLGLRAGLWLIHMPTTNDSSTGNLAIPSTTTITATYAFIDTLVSHIETHVIDQNGSSIRPAWGGPGVYEITLVNDQLILRKPDPDTTGWIVIDRYYSRSIRDRIS